MMCARDGQQMVIGREFYFDSSHHLPKYRGTCENDHGHTYRLVVELSGPICENGMVMDFKRLKEIVGEKVLSRLDHACLNDILENPTAENILEWISNELEGLPLSSLELWEGRGKWAKKRFV